METVCKSVTLVWFFVGFAHSAYIRNGGVEVTELPPPIIENEGETASLEENDDLYQGDIVLTVEQRSLIESRKATPYIGARWPDHTTGNVVVGYRFNDNTIDKDGTLKAVKHWEQHTCVRFEEVASDYSNPHLVFQDANFCASYIGRISSFTSGQPIWLHSSCIAQVGPAVHEIGHALGLFHEQSRSDRDEYVDILFQNIQAGKEGNFNKANTENFDIPYDYRSIMHYGAKYFSKNGQLTIKSKNILAQMLIGNRRGFSFMDKKIINKMYNCNTKWLSECSLSSDPCLNQGYTGINCQCVCPAGTSGNLCQDLEQPYTDALVHEMSPYSEYVYTTGNVSTPGYPTPRQDGTYFMKILVAPECHRVKLEIDDFNVYRRSSGECNIDYLTIQIDLDEIDNPRYCESEISKGTVFTSTKDTMILVYKNYNYTAVSYYTSDFRGFNGIVSHVPISGCIPSSTAAPPTESNLVTLVNSGYVPLTLDMASNCSLNQDQYTSPNYPDYYSYQASCISWLQTSEPRYLRMTVAYEHTHDLDNLVITSVMSTSYRLSRASDGWETTLLTSSPNIAFTADSKQPGLGFVLSFEVANSPCHQIVQLKAGATGNITVANYDPGTICEYWIQAPSGSSVQLSFSSFTVGSSSCLDDYLLLDTAGDSRYLSSSTQYCGSNSPGTVTSSGDQLNLLLNGQTATSSGSFFAIYTVV